MTPVSDPVDVRAGLTGTVDITLMSGSGRVGDGAIPTRWQLVMPSTSGGSEPLNRDDG